MKKKYVIFFLFKKGDKEKAMVFGKNPENW